MQEGPSHHHQQQQPQQRSQRYGGGGLRSTAGEIVEVQGGHIVRSTGRKDRHSKVCTAKGPRDRRVRLSAHTAIQFYDVQDRLGYDRPSKAVDWLIKNAKTAIDELAELPAWHPTATPPSALPPPNQEAAASHGEDSNKQMPVAEQGYEFGSGSGGGGGGGGGGGAAAYSFLPPSLDSDAIADTIKSFFPMAAAADASSSSAPSSSRTGFQSYPPDLMPRTSSQNQDLRLSLQSFQDPIFHHHHHNAAQQHQQHHQENHPNPNAASGHHAAFFSGFDAAASIPWNVVGSSSGGGGNAGGGGGYVFNVPLQQQQAAMAMHPALGQSQFFTQRGPLQSSNLPFVRAWADPIAAAADHPMQQQHSVIHPSAPSIGFASGVGGSGVGFSGFRIPARIQGEEEHDGISDKPSSASSGSHH